MAAPDGQVACRVPCALLLFVAGVVLFIDDDELELRHGCEHRHARTQHDAGLARMGGEPAFQALRGRHAAVHADDGALAQLRCKACLKAGFQLRGQVDFGHHHQHLGSWIALQQLCSLVQVDLGLAATGAAKKQKRAFIGADLCANRSLLWAEGQRCVGSGALWLHLAFAFEPAG